METAQWIALGVLAGFAVYDIKTKQVPVAAVAATALAAAVYRFCTGEGIAFLAAGLVPGALVLLLSYVTKESIGRGDGLVLCAFGLFLGWKPCLAVFGMALVLSAVLAIVLLVLRRAGRKTELPFLPSLFGGYLLYLLW